MKIRDLIVESCVILDLKGTEKKDVLAEMVDALKAAGRIKDANQVLKDILARERQRSTAIRGGIAIPHASTSGASQPVMAFGRSVAGVDFNSVDEKPSTLIFLLIVPAFSIDLPLEIISRLSYILANPSVFETLTKATSVDQVLSVFDQYTNFLGDVELTEGMPTVCVAGAGAGGLAMAGHLALLGCPVRLYNRSEARINPIRDMGGIQVSGVLSGFARIPFVTTDPAQAVAGADLIMVVIPAIGHREMATRLGPFLTDGQVVLLNPGRTGGAMEFANVLREKKYPGHPIVAEAQTLLYACRDINPGSVHVFSIKNAVPVAALPAYLTPDVLALTRKSLPYFVAGDNVLKTSMDNIGSIFHPALTLLNAAWIEDTHGDFDYYLEGASPSVTSILEAMDKERVAIGAALGIGCHSAREWLYLAYGATGDNLYEAIQSNPGYIGIKAPNRLEHRYITEDVPMSLVPMASIAEQLGVKVPAIRSVIHLASLLHERDYWAEGRTVEKLGLAGMNVEQIRRTIVEGFSPGKGTENGISNPAQ
jgi:opine dehydrogenase